MIYVGDSELGRRTRRALRHPAGNDVFHKGEWLDTGTDPDLSPTVFLVEMSPGMVLDTHFHANNQFQLVVRGSGSLGRHALGPVTVHYAGAHTGYGPLKAGPDGLSYFTMRPVFENGAFMLPQDRDRMIRGPRRQMSSDILAPEPDASLAARREVVTSEPIPLQPDGAGATRLVVPPGASVRGPSPAGGGGQYVVVIAGSIVHAGRTLTRWEPVFVTADEPPFEIVAGDAGADVLVLRFAPMAAEYRGVAVGAAVVASAAR